jgi:hypothetical protein
VRIVARVEPLIPAELKEYRVFEAACLGYLKNHSEWLTNVDFKVIVERIEFWAE